MDPMAADVPPSGVTLDIAYVADPWGTKLELIEWTGLWRSLPGPARAEGVNHVAFGVSDIGIESSGMRLATYRAASRADHGEEFGREAALARKLCAAKGMEIGSEGVQLLGGHGFVKEHPVERWYRDLRAAGVMEGALLV